MIDLKRIFPLLGVIALLTAVLAITSHAQSNSGAVERSGLHADLKIDQLISGNLTELNGKYKLRVATVTYEPGGFVGNHHHGFEGIFVFVVMNDRM